MSHKCCYINCDERRRPLCAFSYFKMPKDHRRSVWAKHGSVADMKDSKTYVMCSKHFYLKDIKQKSTLQTLKKDALPISSPSICCCTENAIDSSCVRIMDALRPFTIQKNNSKHQPKLEPAETLVPLSAQPAYSSQPSTSVTPLPSAPPPSFPPLPISLTKNINTFPPTINVPDFIVTDVSSPSQFCAIKLSSSKPINPRKVYRCPKRLNRIRESKLKEELEVEMGNSTDELKTFIYAQLFHKNDSPWGSQEKNLLFVELFKKSPATYTFMLSLGFKLPSISTIHRWRNNRIHSTGPSTLEQNMLTNEENLLHPCDENDTCVEVKGQVSLV